MGRVCDAVVKVYRGLARMTIAVVFLLLILLFGYLFSTSADSFRARGGPAHLQMELAYRKDAWVGYVEEWGEHTGSIESAVQNYRTHLLKLHIVFPLLYVTLFVSAIAFLTNEPDKRPAKWALLLFLLPVVGGIFDLAESYIHFSTLQGVKSVEDLNSIPDLLVSLSFLFTALKWSLIAVPLGLAIPVYLNREFFRMDKQTKDLKDPEDLEDLEGFYPQSLRTAIEREKGYISSRREKAAKEFLVAELERLKARLARGDEEERGELEKKIQAIEEWPKKNEALHRVKVKGRDLEKRLQDIEKGSQDIPGERAEATKQYLKNKWEEKKREIQEIEEWLQIIENFAQQTDEGKQEKYWKEGQDLPAKWEDGIRAFLFLQLSEELPRLRAELARASGEKLDEEQRGKLEKKAKAIEEWLEKEGALDEEGDRRDELEECLKEIAAETRYISAQWAYAAKRFLDKKLSKLKEEKQELDGWLQIFESFTEEKDKEEQDKRESERLLKELRDKEEKIADPGGSRERKVRKSLFQQLSEQLSKLATESTKGDRERPKGPEKRIQEIKEWLHTKVELDKNEAARKELQQQLEHSFNKIEDRLFPDRTIVEHPPIGLAFSGGGIRSATFNLGLVQGLAKYGILPWVDYLTSVSGGGFTAACMTTLLSMDKKTEKEKGKKRKTEYYHFNTQWDYFPFNPKLKAFDGRGVAHTGEPSDEVGPPLKKGINKQLEYLRDKGNFLIPRMGWVTRDVLRAIGAFLVRIAYTMSIFLLVLVAFSAFHYGVTAALTPSIRENVNLNALDMAALIPTNMYLWATLGGGFLFSLSIGRGLSFVYRKDPTRKYQLKPWKSPEEDVTLETHVAISNIRVVALICSLGLFLLTLGLWIGRFQMWWQSATDLRDFYWAWGVLFIALTVAAAWFVLKYTRDYRWAKRGHPEQLRIDHLAACAVAGLFVWVMTLCIAWLRFQYLSNSDRQIFWIWLPAVFTLGSLIGLAVFRISSLWQWVYFEEDRPYDVNSIGRLGKWYFGILKIEPDPEYETVYSEGLGYKESRWSNPEFRSIFSTLQGLVLYGLIAFLVLAFLALPHYFSLGMDEDSGIVVPLATVMVSAGWAALLSYVNLKADFQAPNLIARIIALPSGVRNYVLGLLVIVLNLSIIFLIGSRIDNMGVLQAYGVGVAALVLLCGLGRFADFNYLTLHHFFRDRMADVFMKTEVVTQGGEVEVVRDDREECLAWMTPEGCSAPYHIVLTTLNLPGSWHLELKDRKSQRFILSKYYCGSDITGYVKTRTYRGAFTKYSRAIALSGAAISSGLGYHTFFAQAFMTTLLNVRLGLWMINPDQYKPDVLYKYAKPHQREKRVFWPKYLWDEACGRISERRPLVNLTDGEHTGDGFGLRPLFERRCKVIIVGDASGDPAGQGRGLFSVIRQVKADRGIEVDINIDGTRPAKYDREKNVAEPSQRHFAVGKITYPATVDAEGKQLPETDGWLIYFKAAVTKDDPGPILSYWETHKMDFPVPPTADQFFDEEQWELQRWLGEYTIEHTLLELKSYCGEKIDKIKGKERKSGSDYAEIRKLKTLKKKLVEKWLDHKAIDYDILSNNPEVFEWLMSTLYEISKGPNGKSEK